MKNLTLIYWKDGKWWLGKLMERPDIMTQGRTLVELEENILDAYRLITEDEGMEGVPSTAKRKALAV